LQKKVNKQQKIVTMAKIKLEYIWLDGYEPTQNLRVKLKLKNTKILKETLAEIKMGLDGSSTRQAEGGSSDCLLVPTGFTQTNSH
jgi:glutamine synthetase